MWSPLCVSVLKAPECPHFRGCYVQASMELGPEDVSLLERCPHFRGCYVQASMEKMCPYNIYILYIFSVDHCSIKCWLTSRGLHNPHALSHTHLLTQTLHLPRITMATTAQPMQVQCMYMYTRALLRVIGRMRAIYLYRSFTTVTSHTASFQKR